MGRDWRDKPLAAISKEDMLAILRPAPPVVAAILRARLETILDHAVAHGWHPGPNNPAAWKGNLKELNLWSKLETRHHPAIDWRVLPAFVQDLRTEPTFNHLVLEFLILVAGRSAEVRGALWSEIDLDAALWRLPANRMKTKKEHVVPLSSRACEILQWMADRRHNDRVFPGRKFGGIMDSNALRNLLPKGAALLPQGAVLPCRRKGPSLHGMRSSFMDWAGDNEAIEVPMEVAERALSHAIGGQYFRSYRRGTALAARRTLMQQWSDFLSSAA